jgi:hypothetical protein
MSVAAPDPEWAVGFLDECWWSRVALPTSSGWGEEGPFASSRSRSPRTVLSRRPSAGTPPGRSGAGSEDTSEKSQAERRRGEDRELSSAQAEPVAECRRAQVGTWGKRRVVEPDGLLGAYEVADRVCRVVFSCPHCEHLSIPQKVTWSCTS